MSERNGDRARFPKTRRRKLHRRQRIRALVSGLLTPGAGPSHPSVTATLTDAASAEASLAMQDEGGPMRAGA